MTTGPTPQSFTFRHVYSAAALVQESARQPRLFAELAWDDPHILNCIHRFSRTTLLHHYIYAAISGAETEELYGHHDLYEDSSEMRQDLEEALRIYGVSYLPYAEFARAIVPSSEGFPFKCWLDSQREAFAAYWTLLTDEVFHILFADRSFLLAFNQSLASYLQSGAVHIPERFLTRTGTIKRAGYMPVWLKNAVYCRDHGRCVLCQRDLTGLLSTDRQAHYDHIAPLARWGTNDPANIQLLCARCNRSKSGSVTTTGLAYPVWWARRGPTRKALYSHSDKSASEPVERGQPPR